MVGQATLTLTRRNVQATSTPKGPMTVGCVRENRQLLLFNTEETARASEPEKRETWILLIHPQSKMTRCELSLPAAIDEHGYIFRWTERLILKPVEIDEEFRENYDFEEGAEFDVEVSRRDEG